MWTILTQDRILQGLAAHAMVSALGSYLRREMGAGAFPQPARHDPPH